MNKKFTFLAAAFMVAGIFMTDALGAPSPVPVSQWTAGNYYYLKTASDSYLSLSGMKSDSVIVKSVDASATKAAIDSALWQITNAGTTPAGPVYQFKNKKTQTVLSFAASASTKPVIMSGVNQWTFSDVTGGSAIQAYYGNNQLVALNVAQDTAGKDSLGLGSVSSSTKFTVEAPAEAMSLKANELGDGFQVFQLAFGATYQGNVFVGKNLIARPTADPASGTVAGANYVTLQVLGDETFPSTGMAKYLGVDTLKNVIAGATGVYGALFAQDSTYAANDWHTVGNADFQKFYFTINLKNDALAMFVAAAPSVNSRPLTSVENVRVVYASVLDSKVLTVSDLQSGTTSPAQGAAPSLRVSKGTPSVITTGTGVYFLKSASKGEQGGQYAVSYDKNIPVKLMTEQGFMPSVYQAKGQWYIKENNGMYSVVDRNTNTTIISNEEIFAVQGMPNTYTFGGNSDSITVEYQKNVNWNDKFLGTRHFSAEEIANNGYVLNLISGTPGVDNLYVFTSDSLLQVRAGSTQNAIPFRVVVEQDSIKNTMTGVGAQSLGDTLYHATYKLKERFSNDLIANETDMPLKLSDYTLPQVFVFNTASAGGKYEMQAVGVAPIQYAFMDVNTANLILSDKVNYFDFVAVDAPEYASLPNSHKRFGTNGKYLTMNPLNFFAEVKNEGQEILKSDYTADSFSLWVGQADTVIPGKPLYYISTVRHDQVAKADVAGTRYYLVSLRDSGDVFTNNNVNYYRVGFVANDDMATMKDSPALFAFKTTEEGGYMLENQKELNREVTAPDFKTPYVGVVNNVVVMSNLGVPFTVETVTGPVNNEQITTSEVAVIAGEGHVVVLNASGKKVTLTNILGQTVGSVTVTSDRFTVPASRGIVVVAIEGETAHKVVVK